MRRSLILVFSLTCLTVGSTGHAGTSGGSSFSASQLPGIVDPKPVLPPWSFKVGASESSPAPAHPPALTLADLTGKSAIERAVAKRLGRAGFQVGRTRRWLTVGGGPDHLYSAGVIALLFRNASGATTAFRVFSGGAPSNVGPLAKGLGEQSSGVYTRNGIAYIWRRDNLLVETRMFCRPPRCAHHLVNPARKYAGEIDARAKRQARSAASAVHQPMASG